MQHCCKNSKVVPTEELLKRYNLSRTSIREKMLNVFLESPVPISVNELKHRMDTGCDRVTLYRNLKRFTREGILHEVHLDKYDSKYVLPGSILNPEQQYTEHLHFKCVECDMVRCLTDQEIMKVSLPDGFKMLEANFVVYGVCDSCNTV